MATFYSDDDDDNGNCDVDDDDDGDYNDDDDYREIFDGIAATSARIG